MAGVDNRLLIQEARDLPDPRRNLLTHNERELINLAKQLADALEASDLAYKNLFETCHSVEKATRTRHDVEGYFAAVRPFNAD